MLVEPYEISCFPKMYSRCLRAQSTMDASNTLLICAAINVKAGSSNVHGLQGMQLLGDRSQQHCIAADMGCLLFKEYS